MNVLARSGDAQRVIASTPIVAAMTPATAAAQYNESGILTHAGPNRMPTLLPTMATASTARMATMGNNTKPSMVLPTAAVLPLHGRFAASAAPITIAVTKNADSQNSPRFSARGSRNEAHHAMAGMTAMIRRSFRTSANDALKLFKRCINMPTPATKVAAPAMKANSMA